MRATFILVVLLSAAPVAAQDGAVLAEAASPQKADAWMSDLPDPAAGTVKKKGATKVVSLDEIAAAPARLAPTARIVGSYRPVEPRKLQLTVPEGVTPSGQTGVDLYLDLSEAPGAVAGQSFAVYRKVPAPTLRASEVTIQVGVVTIVSIEGPLAIARVVGGPKASSLPFLRSRGVRVGDFIRADQPMGQAPEVRKKRPRRVKKPAGPATPAAPEAAPVEVKPEPATKSGDGDGYESWGAETDPIEF